MSPLLSFRLHEFAHSARGVDANDAFDSLMLMMRQEGTIKRNKSLLERSEPSDDVPGWGEDPSSTAVHSFQSFVEPKTSNLVEGSNSVNEIWRMKICSWCYDVIDSMCLQRETAYFCMSYLDRFFSTEAGRPLSRERETFQLSALTTLHLAVKIHEPTQIDLRFLSALSRGLYSVEQIAQMEKRVLMALDWKMHTPTPAAFLRFMSRLLPDEIGKFANESLLVLGQYQIEASLLYSFFTNCAPSEVALAAILNVISLDNTARACLSTGQFQSFLSSVLECNPRKLERVRQELQRAFLQETGYELHDSPVLDSQSEKQI